MTNYTKSTNFATKDTLTSGDPLKIVKGTEINTEFDNISTAIATKADTASPTFTGTVTIPTLTASSAVATNASNALVSVTNTGTGNNVLATSPALVTPILGTPTSATLTNATGLPLTTGVTGVLLEANGGTGSSTGNQMFKNRIINGQMQIAQRATSATITAASTIALGYSTVDRFYVYCTGANVTVAQVAGTGATKNNLQITGAASVTAVGIGQRIEQLNSYDMAGSTATLSVNISNSLLTTVTWTAYYATTADTFGTLASPTRTQISTGTFTVTSTLTNYSAQISIPAAATTGIEVVFTVGAQTSGTWVIGNVQLEKGSTATSFDYRPYGTELALCQRYYEMSYDIGTAPASSTTTGLRLLSWAISGTNGGTGGIVFQIPKRAAPTLATYDGAGTANNVTTTTAAASPTYTNGRAYAGAPYNITTNEFIHPGQSIIGNVHNFIHFTASAEL